MIIFLQALLFWFLMVYISQYHMLDWRFVVSRILLIHMIGFFILEFFLKKVNDLPAILITLTLITVMLYWFLVHTIGAVSRFKRILILITYFGLSILFGFVLRKM